MSLDVRLNLKLAQRLVMTPNLQQAIKLLQFSRLELQSYISQEMLENPMIEESLLEEPEEAEENQQNEDKGQPIPSTESPEAEKVVNAEMEWERYFDDGVDYGLGYMPREAREPVLYENFVRRTDSLHDHLNWQLQMSNLDDAGRNIGYYLIGNISDDGYLYDDLEELARTERLPVEELERVLAIIHKFDPVGVGSRNLSECLLVQMDHLGIEDELAREIVKNHLPLLERKRYNELSRAMRRSLEELKPALEVIEALEPRPGREFAIQPTLYVVPDVYVEKVDGEYIITLNDDGLPNLRISGFYKRLLSREMNGGSDDGQTKEFLEKKFRSAVWLMKSVEQRQRTIYKVASSIVRKQRDFFDKGIRSLKPMVLRDVAEDIDMHESTVSRVSTNKYLHCAQGVFELKFFFHSGITGENGEGVSSLRIKEIIREEISREDSQKPLSDQKLAQVLERRMGVTIARRTVAKYRIDMNIPSSSQRKSL
jgi:RNA polymerase sigma-54 factor